METSKQAKARIDIDALRDALPHGSGIDCNWTFSENKDGSVRCSNAWHAMNEHGYYCGYIPFTFTVRHARRDELALARVPLRVSAVRGGFKRAARATLHTGDLADYIAELVCGSIRAAGDRLVLPTTEGGAS